MQFPQILKQTDQTITFDCGCTFAIKGGIPIIDYQNINISCCKTWELLATGKTLGVFQLENRGLGGHWSKAMKPSSIEEIAQLISIIRPGCLNVKFEDGKSATHHFVERKLGNKKAEPIHSSVEPILKDTHQIILYQEQAIRIAKDVAGFSLVEADQLRVAIGKKLPELMSSLRTKFIEGCVSHSKLDKEVGELLFDTIEKSNKYNFNLCLHKDTVIKRPHSNEKFTIEQLYKNKNEFQHDFGYGLSMANRSVIKNIIRDITYQGKQECHCIRLKDRNHYIEATKNHKFPTSLGTQTLEEILDKIKFHDYEIQLFVCCENNGNYHIESSYIWDIYSVGVHDVYDVEMAAPYHNFITDTNIITSNSHATGYAITSQWCAYAKSHFPLRFYCASLINAKKKSAKNPLIEVKDLVTEGKHFNIQFSPPSLLKSQSDFSICKNSIYFGLQNIHGIGSSQAKVILEEKIKLVDLLKRPLDKIIWLEYLVCFFDNLNITAAKHLIISGAFDFFNIRRKRLLYELETWKKLTDIERKRIRNEFILALRQNKLFDGIENPNSLLALLQRLVKFPVGNKKTVSSQKRKTSLLSLIKTLEKPPYKLEDTVLDIIKWEESLLGVAVLYNRVNANEKVSIDSTCKEILDGKRSFCTVGINVDKVKPHKVKKGKNKGNLMAFLEGHDDSASLNVVCFPDVYYECGSLLYENNTIGVVGSKSQDNDDFLAKKIVQL